MAMRRNHSHGSVATDLANLPHIPAAAEPATHEVSTREVCAARRGLRVPSRALAARPIRMRRSMDGRPHTAGHTRPVHMDQSAYGGSARDGPYMTSPWGTTRRDQGSVGLRRAAMNMASVP